MMTNIPQVKLGIIAVSRDCFPIALSTQRRQNIASMSAPSLWRMRRMPSRLWRT